MLSSHAEAVKRLDLFQSPARGEMAASYGVQLQGALVDRLDKHAQHNAQAASAAARKSF